MRWIGLVGMLGLKEHVDEHFGQSRLVELAD